MSDEQLVTTAGPSAIEQVLIQGDLSKLSEVDRTRYYLKVCESLGLNPLTQPFEYIVLGGKLKLYARKDATEQLRRRDGVSIVIVNRQLVSGAYVVTARATLPSGRCDEADGVVWVDGLKGEQMAVALMRAETKSKRRVTLSLCGLGMLDEAEVDGVPVTVEHRPVAALADTPKSEAYKELSGKLETAQSPEDVAAVGKVMKERKGELGTGEWESLVEKGATRRKELVKSPAAVG